MGKLLSPLGSNAVHLCIDMQNLFTSGAPWATPWMERVVPQTVALTEHAPERTIFTRFIPPHNMQAARGVWRAYYAKWKCVTLDKIDPHMIELASPLASYVPPAAIIDRQTYSAFSNGRLKIFLDERKVDTLIISGGETDVCVLASVLAAVDIGYRVVLAEDAVCSSSDESHDAMIDLYTKRFDIQIEVASTPSILECWKIVS